LGVISGDERFFRNVCRRLAYSEIGGFHQRVCENIFKLSLKSMEESQNRHLEFFDRVTVCTIEVNRSISSCQVPMFSITWTGVTTQHEEILLLLRPQPKIVQAQCFAFDWQQKFEIARVTKSSAGCKQVRFVSSEQ
jgi:predicted ATPase